MSKNVKIIILIVVAAVLCVALVWGISIQNVLFMPFGPYFGEQSGEYTRQTEFEADVQGIQNIYLDFISEEMTVVPTDGTKIRIEQTSNGPLEQDEMMKCAVSGDTLRARSGLDSKIWFSWGKYRDIRVKVYLPASYKNNIGMHTVSGTISAQDFSPAGLKVVTRSGTISLRNVQANTADVSSISGSMNLRDIRAGTIDLHETSGTVTLVGGSFESVAAHSVSGEITVDVQKTGSVDAGTTSGTINISVEQMPAKINAGTVSGSVTLKLPENEGFTIKHSTVSGSYSNDFAMANDVYHNGRNMVEVGTTSGSINIIKK